MNFIVAPASISNLDWLLTKDIKAILIGIEGFSITPSFRMSIDEVIELASKTNKEIIVSVNKMMHNSDLSKLEEILIKINNSSISKVLFYDLSVLNIAKRLGLKQELIISQEHLNASINTNNFFNKNGVSYSLITSDITKDEVNEITGSSKMNIIATIYGYLPIFYSRRYLIDNYLTYINKEKEDGLYYLKHNDDYYIIKEEEFGTVIYTKAPINLIGKYQELSNVSYYLIDGSYIDDNEFKIVVDDFLENRMKEDNYLGFFDTKTIYKVKKDEK